MGCEYYYNNFKNLSRLLMLSSNQWMYENGGKYKTPLSLHKRWGTIGLISYLGPIPGKPYQNLSVSNLFDLVDL